MTKKILSYFSISFGLLLILGSLFFAYRSLKNLSLQNLSVTNTINVFNQTSRFELIAKSVQSSVRGYLITEDKMVLSDINAAKRQLVSISDTLYFLLKDDQPQKTRVTQMLAITAEIVQFSQAVIDSFEVQGRQSASYMIKSGTGIRLFEALSAKNNEIALYAQIELDSRQQLSNRMLNRTILYIALTGVTGFGITLLTLYFLFQDGKRQRILKQEIYRKERLLNQYLEAMPDGIIVVDPALRVTFINASGRQMLGLAQNQEVRTLESLMDRIDLYKHAGSSHLYTPEDLPVSQGLRGKKTSGNRIDIKRANQWLNIETSVEPIYEIDGEIVGALSVFRDVTQREAYAANLEKARDIAERSVKIRDVFLSNVSHEIRTPLNAILGFTYWLRKEVREGRVAEYVGYIQTASHNLLGLINDLLDISKIEANQIVLDEGPTEIAGLVDSVGIMIKQKALEKNIQYQQKLADDLPAAILTDKLRLSQILLNLCGNAVKFTERGYVRVEVKALGPIEQGMQRIQFVIADTGIGIPEDQQAQIFDRFHQASKHTSSRFGGTGLGLSIAKALVELLGGQMRMESAEGRGTTFTLEFSFAVVAAPASQDIGDMPTSTLDHMASLSVLAAEDNVLNQKLLKAIFNRAGTSCTVVDNGLEAVEKLKEELFDVIIMDVQMPVMDGYTAIREIRNTLGLSIPIITMTAHAMVDEKEEGMRIGANSYLSKPFKEEDLFRTIINLTQKMAAPVLAGGEAAAVRPPVGAAVVDFAYLREITANDKALRGELIELFVDDVPRQYEAMHDALRTEDYDRLRQMVHSLRSTLMSVAMLGSAAKFKEIEKALSSGVVPDELAAQLTSLEVELRLGLEELRAMD